jgi:hypothetical protein
MTQRVLERFLMVTGFEINPLHFLSTAAQEFQFPNGAALSNDKPIHTSLIFQFLAKSTTKPYFFNHRDQPKLSPTKKSISAADYTTAYSQTEISQEFSWASTDT